VRAENAVRLESVTNPTERWVTQQARNLLMALAEQEPVGVGNLDSLGREGVRALVGVSAVRVKVGRVSGRCRKEVGRVAVCV
jgi:hypothetical protein